MPIWQLCANLLIPNCLRSNLSYSPLAALEPYVNQGKSQINAYIKDRLKAFELDVSEMPIIDKMEDEHQDSYYTTYLQPEDIEIPEDFLSIPLSVR